MIVLSQAQHQITLRNPDFEDSHNLDSDLKLKKTMSGVKYSYIRTPVIATRSFKFTKMNVNKAEELRLFLIATAGKEIEMRDFEKKIWKGRVLNNPETFVHVASRDMQFSLEFEGFIIGEFVE